MVCAIFLLGFLAIATANLQNPTIVDNSDDSRNRNDATTAYQKLLQTRKALLSRLDRCTLWRENLTDERKNYLHSLLIKADFEKEVAIQIAKEVSPEDEDCLKSLSHLIKKYNRSKDRAKQARNEEDGSHIEEFLSPRQISELHAIYRHTKKKDGIIKALMRFFDGMPQEKKQSLIDEFFAYKVDLRRRPRHASEVDSSSQEESSPAAEDPEEISRDWLEWMNVRQKNLVEKMKSGGSDKWEIMTTISDQYYHQRKDVRRKYDRHFQTYCNRNLKSVLGHDNFVVLENMFLDNDPVDQIETRFHEMVGDLRSERSRVLAGKDLLKIFRLVHFEPTDLTTWLNSHQKSELGEMISDPDIGDQQVYEKVYEFFEAATGEQKEDATDTIDTGCRHFIAHMFGDDTAEELEDLKLQGNVSTQYLAARLAKHMKEISSEKERRRAEQSLPMCTRIYLNYNGSCDCNRHAVTCDKTYHTCQNCSDFTYGVQCEHCIEGFTGDPRSGGCTAIEVEEETVETGDQLCECNQHTSHCDEVGKCIRCQHNTAGDNCEVCAAGYYGDATKGGADDCSICPCPDGGACFINEDGLVQCSRCPAGLKGVTCDKKDNPSSESSEEQGRY